MWRTPLIPRRLAALAAMLAVIAVSGIAEAGACKITTRDIGMINDATKNRKGNTKVINKSHSSLLIEIYKWDSVKNSSTVATGAHLEYTASYAMNKGMDVRVEISDAAGTKTAICEYYISDAEGSTTWETWGTGQNVPPVCRSIDSFCTDCQISCDKSFNKDKLRWNTTYTVTGGGID